ncbi:HAD family hydrolase [Luedemannella flava]|uniref:HAD family hydrolase n=1 Tax=Luedemannella flava TaxID=349316 RepID=UPI0031E062AE
MRAVLLDVGGVLVVPDPRAVGGVMGGHGGATDPDDLIRAHYRAVHEADGDDGDFDWPGYHTGLVVHSGVPVGARELCNQGMIELVRAMPNLWSYPLPGMAATLRALAGRYRLGIVSNNDGTVGRLLAEQGLCQLGAGPAAPVEVIVDSALAGVAKPDPRIFTLALDVLGLPPEEVGYVGDTRAYDVSGARAAGLRPFHLDPYGFCVAADHEHLADLADLL